MDARWFRRGLAGVLALWWVTNGLGIDSLSACPLCGPPTLTLSEQYANAATVLVVRWKASHPGKGEDDSGKTLYEVVHVLKDASGLWKAGQTWERQDERECPTENQFLLFGSRDKTVTWSEPLAMRDAAITYLREAPLPSRPGPERLAYFVNFLASPDLVISNDAHAEFVNAPSKDIVAISKKLPRTWLREQLRRTDLRGTRLALYALLLGWCGDQEDARLLESRILIEPKSERFGIEGVIGGYLLIEGTKGLELIVQSKLSGTSVPTNETIAAVQAIRFLWSDAPDRVPKDRLQTALRPLIERPDLIEVVLPDLARWKDWRVQDRLVILYSLDQFQDQAIRKAIICYLVASTKDVPQSPTAARPRHAAEAARHLDAFREKDRKFVEWVEKSFY